MVGFRKFRKTKGACRGNKNNYPGEKTLWKCVGRYDNAGCGSKCLADPVCGAYARPDISGAGECCLFRPGNTGNNNNGRVCYVKPTGACSSLHYQINLVVFHS